MTARRRRCRPSPCARRVRRNIAIRMIAVFTQKRWPAHPAGRPHRSLPSGERERRAPAAPTRSNLPLVLSREAISSPLRDWAAIISHATQPTLRPSRACARLKRRDAKPFALMARDLDVISRYCAIDAVEERELTSVEAPIVLLRAKGPEHLPEAVAPGLDTLGFMLPTTPLHLLLVRSVRTSARDDERQYLGRARSRRRRGGVPTACRYRVLCVDA